MWGACAGSQPPPSAQLLYEAGLAVWQLTFYVPAAAAMGSAGVVAGLVELARHGSKEKVRGGGHPPRLARGALLGTLAGGRCMHQHQ